MISGVSQVGLFVKDQDAAKRFWTEKMGFEVATDQSYGEGQRWLEVVPPDGNVRLTLHRWQEQWAPNLDAIPDELPHSNVFFTCDGIEQTYKELTERGVRFPQSSTRQFWGWWSMFEDQDGTRYALNQRGD